MLFILKSKIQYKISKIFKNKGWDFLYKSNYTLLCLCLFFFFPLAIMDQHFDSLFLLGCPKWMESCEIINEMIKSIVRRVGLILYIRLNPLFILIF